MKQNNIDNLFEKLRSDFDIENPSIGHHERFLSKLATNSSINEQPNLNKFRFWKPFIGIAASLILCFSLSNILNSTEETKGLASVSPEMSQTENFFTNTISSELLKLNESRTPDTEILINDAMKQMEILEKDYEILKGNLAESGNDKRVIYAMISNFQTRIDLLKNVMETIENVKQLKNKKNETSITI